MSNRQATLVMGAIIAGVTSSFFAYGQERELPPIKPGQEFETASDFLLADLHGERVRLSEVDAPVVILHFWSKYRDCRYDLELLEDLHKKYYDRGVRVIGVAFSSGTRDEIETFVTDFGVEFPILMCTDEVRTAYDVSTFPTTYLLDSDKKIRYWMYGILVDTHWDRLVGELLDESSK